jgi:hypothetical protein
MVLIKPAKISSLEKTTDLSGSSNLSVGVGVGKTYTSIRLLLGTMPAYQ